ncbi:uncharacterized protein N7459_000506 [Penicillium hispanicum]|uniref:uncharacterized protein n=1 Tax=Penicillium hispanicum TaxID=1080232 RepID=UPI00253F7F3A|nr:uncharacterized protein N7459_000506 [Penicillium hispanicum]KAJ5594298.1 hypothetical protein N7459_000506 [Penicillium hispanicum]
MAKRRKSIHISRQLPSTKPQPTLTPSLPESEDECERQRQETYNQHQSLFFRLPPELRDMIYHEIIVFPHTIYLGLFELNNAELFYSMLCRFKEVDRRVEEEVKLPPTVAFPWLPPLKPDKKSRVLEPTEYSEPPPPVISLLLSCRRIYSETIDTLYRKNKFCIGHSSILLKLLKIIPQPQLAAFSHLTILSPWFAHEEGFSVKRPVLSGKEEWKGVVTALNQFTGLRTLRVAMHCRVGIRLEPKYLSKPLEAANLPFTLMVTDDIYFK